MPERWTAETIPAPLVAILDGQAGKEHSATGSVRQCVADILNEYDTLRDAWACEIAEEALIAESGPEWARLVRESRDVPLTLGVGGPVVGTATVATDGTVAARTADPDVVAVLKPGIRAFSIGTVPERERLVHENPALAAQIRQGIDEAERGETVDRGSFAQYLDEDDDA